MNQMLFLLPVFIFRLFYFPTVWVGKHAINIMRKHVSFRALLQTLNVFSGTVELLTSSTFLKRTFNQSNSLRQVMSHRHIDPRSNKQPTSSSFYHHLSVYFLIDF